MFNNFDLFHFFLSSCFSGLFKKVFAEQLDSICLNSPYFVERCIYFVFRCACEVFPQSLSSPVFEPRRLAPSIDLPLTAPPGTVDLWTSLRMLRSLPMEVTATLSDRLGAALQYFIRFILIMQLQCLSI